MSKYRQAARTDVNQSEIVRKLRQVPGVSVSPDHDDLLVGYQGRTYWIEIKDPCRTLNKNGTMHRKQAKQSQIKLLREWSGQYAMCWTFEDVLDVIGIAKNPDKLCGHCWLESKDNDPRCVCGGVV